jgi:hypothetical protein
VQRARAKRESEPAEHLDETAARLSALERLKRDLDYRLPGSGKPLAHVVLTHEQAAELLGNAGAKLD